MYVLSTDEMARIDRRMIEEMGVPAIELMENAGTAVANEIEKRLDVWGKSVLVACGKGNNGGDGYVVARLLSERGARVHVLMSDEPGISSEAGLMFGKLPESVEVISIDEAARQSFDFAIDAIFGTGFKGAADGIYAEMIDCVNACPTVFAIDIPSGINGNTGVPEGAFVKANYTFALCREKWAHRIYPARGFCGEITVCNIGITNKAVEAEHPRVRLFEKADMDKLLKPLSPADHKGTNGKLLIIGGSTGMAGSVCLAAQAAMRAGVGLCYAAVPNSIYEIVASKLTEQIVIPLENSMRSTLSPLNIDKLKPLINKVDAIVLGCGMSLNSDTQAFVKEIAKHITVPVVVDADGINAVSTQRDFFENCEGEIILTPHNVEMTRLTGKNLNEIKNRRIQCAAKFAKEKGCIIALKGSGTVVTNGESAFINTSGNPGMATGGSGDVLSGIIGAFAASGISGFNAAACGVFAHGMAGDIAAKRLSMRGMIASDIIESLPYCFR